MFVGREQELKFFEDRYKSAGGQLIVLYGRRRIGKTELLQQFCEGKPHIYFTCRETTDSKQLESYSERILEAGSPAAGYINVFKDWESAFRGFSDLPASRAKKLLIIDEFQYMCKGNPSIPSILQFLWDDLLRKQNIMIVLCGSAMSFFENSILSEKNPLYGRATGIYKLTELPFVDSIKFFPDYSSEDKMLAYAVLGGIPHYLRQFDPDLSLRANIIANTLTKGCVLYNEVEFLVRQELREPALYNTLLETIAYGNTKLNDIYLKTLIDKSKLSVYIKNLIELQILQREFPVMSSIQEQTSLTRGLYRITDNYFRFWYSFVFPNLSDLERGDTGGVFDHAVRPQLNDFASSAFERVCLEFIRVKNRNNEFSFRVSKLGRWWGKLNMPVSVDTGKPRFNSVASEIDIVAADSQSQHFILGECKFRNSEMSAADLERLKGKALLVNNGAAVQYILFSKSGFTDSLVKQAKQDESLSLYTLDDIVAQYTAM